MSMETTPEQRKRWYGEGEDSTAWHLGQVSACALIRDLDAAVEALEDFRDHGTRHDTQPTCIGPDGPPRTAGWYGYVQEMDDYVREKARAVLAPK